MKQDKIIFRTHATCDGCGVVFAGDVEFTKEEYSIHLYSHRTGLPPEWACVIFDSFTGLSYQIFHNDECLKEWRISHGDIPDENEIRIA